MPDPMKYEDKQDFMADCMHQLRKVEKRPQDQSVAICLSMWRRKKEKGNKENKRVCVGTEIKRYANLLKEAIPHFLLTQTYPFLAVDLFFEKLDPESIEAVIDDLLKGEVIYVPADLYSSMYTSFSLADLDEVDRKRAEDYFKHFRETGVKKRKFLNFFKKPVFTYNKNKKMYERIKEKKDIYKE